MTTTIPWPWVIGAAIGLFSAAVIVAGVIAASVRRDDDTGPDSFFRGDAQ